MILTKMEEDSYDKIPARVLNVASRRLLSRHLNPPALIPLKDGQMPDWSGLAELMDFDYLDIKNFELKEDRTNAVLDAWTVKEGSTIGQLLEILKQLERNDILAEIDPYLDRDVKAYKKRKENEQRQRDQFLNIVAPVQVHEVTDSTALVASSWRPTNDPKPSFETITTEDMEHLIDKKSAPMMYDAFVSFAKSDQEFVVEMAEKLEGPQYKLKLCIAPRQLLLGQQESVVTAELIARRCKRIIIVLSPDFLRSEICDFQVKFAHNISPGSRRKKLIPVIAHPVVADQIPLILRHVSYVDKSRSDFQDVFYRRLALSLQQPFSWSAEDEGQELGSIIPPESPDISSPSMSSSSSSMGSSSAGISSKSSGFGSPESQAGSGSRSLSLKPSGSGTSLSNLSSSSRNSSSTSLSKDSGAQGSSSSSSKGFSINLPFRKKKGRTSKMRQGPIEPPRKEEQMDTKDDDDFEHITFV